MDDEIRSSIRSRVKYRNKSIWLCYLCFPFCANCKQSKQKHPTENCNHYESEGREVSFEEGQEWFLVDLHLIHFHKQEMIKMIQDKYLEKTNEYSRDKNIWICKLCNPVEGKEVSFDRRKEWHLVSEHIKGLHLKEMLDEMHEDQVKRLSIEEHLQPI